MFFGLLNEKNLREIADGFPKKANLGELTFVPNDQIKGVQVPYGYFNASLTDGDILTSPKFFVTVMERGTQFIRRKTREEDERTRKEYLAVVIHISGEYGKGLYLAEERGQPNIILFNDAPINAVILIPCKRNTRENAIEIMVAFTREGLADLRYKRTGKDEMGIRELLDTHQN